MPESAIAAYREFFRECDSGFQEVEDGVLVSLASLQGYFDNHKISQALVTNPEKYIPKVEKAARSVVQKSAVGISDIEPIPASEIEADYVGSIKSIRGYITETSGVERFPEVAAFRCKKCTAVTEGSVQISVFQAKVYDLSQSSAVWR